MFDDLDSLRLTDNFSNIIKRRLADIRQGAEVAQQSSNTLLAYALDALQASLDKVLATTVDPVS